MDTKFTVGTISMSETTVGKLDFEISTSLLHPVLPQHTGRYNVSKRVKRSHAVVEAGMFMTSRTPVPQYLPEQWSSYTHPEGAVYFARNGLLRVVTDAYLYKPENADRVLAWVSLIERHASEKGFYISESMELYIQLEGDNCNYYFADHATRTLFWLEDYETEELGLLAVVSPSHLKLQIEEQYWSHVEAFCMHSPNLEGNIIEEAIGQLIHACGDQMTSSSSTFAYTFKDCKQFLEILTPARHRINDGHVITLVARIFCTITHNKYWTHYGQEQARLSRDASILDDENSREVVSWPSALASRVSFRSSDFFLTRLNTIFTDEYVYADDWTKLMSVCMTKWRNASMQSLALLMLHIFCFFLPVSQTLATISAGSLSLSVLTAVALIHRHQELETGTAGDAFEYLYRNKSRRFGFQKLAIVFSLPQVFSLWGLIFTSSQAFSFLESSTLVFLASLFAFACALYVCYQAVSRATRRISGLCHRLFASSESKEDAAENLV